jgi:hypothetical protein
MKCTLDKILLNQASGTDNMHMEAPPLLPETEIAIACDGYRLALGDLPPQIRQDAETTLQQVMPPHWALEWSLPYWLGQRFDLPPEVVRCLVRSNVLGLAYIHLQDALNDGELRAIPAEQAPLLSTALFHRWLRQYVALFGANRLFWDQFDRYVDEWLCATSAGEAAQLSGIGDLNPVALLALAHRGAPLKACCAAVCLLAGRTHALSALTGAVDQLLAGAVLLDQLQDWQADLASGRHNAFIAFVSPLPQTRSRRAANNSRVLDALYVGEGVGPYFEIIARTLRDAGERSRPLDCAGLGAYIAWLDAQATAYRDRLTARAAARLHDFAGEFLESREPILESRE